MSQFEPSVCLMVWYTATWKLDVHIFLYARIVPDHPLQLEFIGLLHDQE
jgi:hypothetical protein